MKVGDLVSVTDLGMCLVMGFHLPAGGDYEMVEVFYMTGKLGNIQLLILRR